MVPAETKGNAAVVTEALQPRLRNTPGEPRIRRATGDLADDGETFKTWVQE